jgi:hypothetical protein
MAEGDARAGIRGLVVAVGFLAAAALREAQHVRADIRERAQQEMAAGRLGVRRAGAVDVNRRLAPLASYLEHEEPFLRGAWCRHGACPVVNAMSGG